MQAVANNFCPLKEADPIQSEHVCEPRNQVSLLKIVFLNTF